MPDPPPSTARVPHKKPRLEGGMDSLASDQLRTAVEEWFQKKFCYSPPTDGDWRLPHIAAGSAGERGKAWQVASLMRMKEELNAMKSQLNDKDAGRWHEHTCSTNPAGTVVRELKLCKVEFPTQAWAKFFEILSSFPIAQPQLGGPFNSLHLCEAPGAFVAALNHYLHRKGCRSDWRWLASTLNPYYEGNGLGEMIADDRFLRGTVANWYFGRDDTGNLMCPENLSELQAKAGAMGDVHLVTADGSIDCMQDPAEQESIVSALHHWETLAALSVLAQGGSFVLKVFTMLEAPAVCLTYLLTCLFQQVGVFKPGTSKGGNSEVYMVCQGFDKSKADCHLPELLKFLTDCNTDPGPLFKRADLPDSFLEQHEQCEAFFVNLQTGVIERNMQLFRHKSAEDAKWLERLRQGCLDHFFGHYNIGYIRSDARIRPPGSQAWKVFEETRRPLLWYNDRAGKQCSSHAKRQWLASLRWQQRIHEPSLYPDFSQGLATAQREFILRSLHTVQGGEVKLWRVTRGRPLTAVRSSRLCQGKLLDIANEIMEHVQVRELQQQGSKTVSFFLLETVLTVLGSDERDGAERVYLWNARPDVLSPVKARLEHSCQCCDFEDLPVIQDSQDSACVGSPSRTDAWGPREDFAGGKGGGFSPAKLHLGVAGDEDPSLRPSTNSMVWRVSKQSSHPSLPCTRVLPQSGVSGSPSSSSPSKSSVFESARGRRRGKRTWAAGEGSSPRTSTSSGDSAVEREEGEDDGVCESSGEHPREVSSGRTGGGEVSWTGGAASSGVHVSGCGQGGGDCWSGIQPVRGGDGVVVVASVVAKDCPLQAEELATRPGLLKFTLELLKRLPQGSDVVLHMSTSLTRFTCGLVYVLARSFAEAALRPVPGGLHLQMVLVLRDFQRPGAGLLGYLEPLSELPPGSLLHQSQAESSPCDGASSPSLDVLSLLHATELFDDVNFVNQVRGANELLVAAFIQTLLDRERACHPQDPKGSPS